MFVCRDYSENAVECAVKPMLAQRRALADALFEGAGGGARTLPEDDLADLSLEQCDLGGRTFGHGRNSLALVDRARS